MSSCQRKLGWGVLLWADEERGIPSGTVLPVYIKSNIERVWVVGVPKAYALADDTSKMFEVPLPELDFAGSKWAAKKKAREFGQYLRTYAETLQDGLPVRDAPDNGSRRVYRLRQGEVVKILGIEEGNPAISATGDPLPGDWYRVLTENGTRGYCFSYRLRFFEHTPGSKLQASLAAQNAGGDSELEKVFSTNWVSEVYAAMLRDRKLDLDALSKKWRFTIGEDTGEARIYAPSSPLSERNAAEIDVSFTYSEIKRLGERDWALVDAGGTSVLTLSLLNDEQLSVQYTNSAGLPRTVYFASLSVPLDDLIVQETARIDDLWETLLSYGSTWYSAYYGRITLERGKTIIWQGYDRLVPQYIPAEALPTGTVSFSAHLDPSLEKLYTGALTIRFNLLGGRTSSVNFLYLVEEGTAPGAYGLRLEFVPFDNIENNTVKRRTPSPLILYFYYGT